MFGVGAALALLFVVWGIAAPDSLGSTAETMLEGLMRGGGWGFVLAATAFVAFALFLAFSRFGRIKLGTDDEQPEFRTVSWIAMMFSAGMGIGLMFFGVTEPLSFFTTSTPPGAAEPGTTEAMQVAMATSLFHWTLHPWAIYAVVGLAIAYSTFRKGRRQLISQAFIPLIGHRAAEGPIGKAIDILAIFATLFGSAASLGLGAYQIGGGMQTVGWSDGPVGPGTLAAIIVVLTAAFVLSAVSGVARGIQWLSNTNMVLAGVLALFVFVAGPTVIILDLIPTSIGAYFAQFFDMVGRTEAVGGEPMLDWLSDWTIFYWAWWISWTPFVGMFLARISRGRTIREFVGGVILAPSLVSLVWFCIFGGTAITQSQQGTQFSDDSNVQLFQMLDAYPLATASGILVMILVGIFFVSGADAASIVMGTLSQRGTIEPSRWIVIFWGAVMGAVAVLMLLTGGENALDGIQNLTILVAAPFVIIMVLLC
ncbi:BCCT family transporter, partial [Pseudonocardia saturnea]|uniref:BCCT family transporter n=1 Tax=Pseudonocardia saturnea TaxID=33909 RepID=UPI001FEBE7A8